MRRDARRLLEKLNRKDLTYHEFEDPFSETELWPIFAAVLSDHGIVGDEAVVPFRHKAQLKESSPVLQTRKPLSEPNQLFANYSISPRNPATRKDVDLREFFSRFSEME